MAKLSLSSLERFVSDFENQAFWIGIDVHKRSYYIALRRTEGSSMTWVAPAAPGALVEQLVRLGIPVAAVAFESGPTGFTLARALDKANIPVIVAAPSRIPRSVTGGAKCDRLDCLKLAEYAAKGMLKPIAVPTPEEEARRSLMRRRHILVESVRRSKQRIKSLLLFHGLPEPAEVTNWSRKAPESLCALSWEPMAKLTLQSYLRELEFFQIELRSVESELQQMIKTAESCQSVAYLQTVPGVGPTVSATFVLELFRPERFRRAEEVASYLGLAPMVRQSGDKTASNRLVPRGQTRLRCLLIEAAWIWKTKDAAAAELYNRLVARTGIPQKAIAAVARRLAIILWRLMVEQRPYRMVTVKP